MTRIDVHQHVWTEPLLDALSARRRLPFVCRTPEGLTVLHSAGERAYMIDVAAEAPSRRLALLRDDRIDIAVIALSSPIGIEMLPRGDALALISAHLDGVLGLGPAFAAWGPLPVATPTPDDVDHLLERGCIGVSVPANALAGPQECEQILPILEHVESRGVPVFIHPGAPGGPGTVEASCREPLWWRALTDYVAQMQAAWLTFAAWGRRRLPNLRTVFAMLAGGAPLLAERLSARGGPPVDVRDPLTFYDTSSYGPRMVETIARWVGPGQLLYGSDRPVIEPVLTGREAELMVNSANLLTHLEVPA